VWPPFAHASTSEASVPPGFYSIEPIHTRVLFAVSRFKVTTWYGDFAHASGTLELYPSDPKRTRVAVRLPASSIASTNSVLDAQLRGPGWFDVARYPDIGFQSVRVTRTTPGEADVLGYFTLHGVTREIMLHTHFNGAGISPLDHKYTVGFEVSGDIRRSDFGLTKLRALVGDTVHIIISAAFVRAVR
jgi:polyisoprenoid-binding protein YceI